MTQNIREFLMPTRLIMGQGSIKRVGDEFQKLGVDKVCIITDKGVKKAGLVDPITKLLKKKKFSFSIFDDVIANPTTDVINRAYDGYRKDNCNGVLALGGGSSIDAAKGVSILGTNGGKIENYIGMDIYQNQPAPLIVIPTTVGTGSEVTRGLVVTDTAKKKKLIVRGMNLYPRIGILDVEMIRSLPGRIIAATGMDALTHSIEGYVSTFSNPISDGLHRQAISMIGQNLRAAVANASVNIKPLENMLFGSTIAGIAFANSLLGLVHAMSHPVSAHFDVAHGDANAILLPHVMRFNWLGNPERFADIALLLGTHQTENIFDIAKSAADAVTELSCDIGIPSGLTEVGVPVEAIEMLAQDAVQEALANTNPRPASYENVLAIYKLAM